MYIRSIILRQPGVYTEAGQTSSLGLVGEASILPGFIFTGLTIRPEFLLLTTSFYRKQPTAHRPSNTQIKQAAHLSRIIDWYINKTSEARDPSVIIRKADLP